MLITKGSVINVVKAVVPQVPGDVGERELLEEDLHRIGCHRFLEKP